MSGLSFGYTMGCRSEMVFDFPILSVIHDAKTAYRPGKTNKNATQGSKETPVAAAR